MHYVDAYLRYLKDPFNAGNLSVMLGVIENGDGSSVYTDALAAIMQSSLKRKIARGSTECRSSGSTKCLPSNYQWGPHMGPIASALWYFCHRFWTAEERYYLVFGDLFPTTVSSKMKRCECNVISVNPSDLSAVARFVDDGPRRVYVTNPMTLARLMLHESVIDWMAKSASTISLTETDSSAYSFKLLEDRGIHVTNQMRSWKEGTIFYTCPFGIKHFAENLFHLVGDGTVVDLMNLSRGYTPVENPDCIAAVSTSWTTCKCGATYRNMVFRPHAVRAFRDLNNHPINATMVGPRLRHLVVVHPCLQIIQRSDDPMDFDLYGGPYSAEEIQYLEHELADACALGTARMHEMPGSFSVGHGIKYPIMYSLPPNAP